MPTRLSQRDGIATPLRRLDRVALPGNYLLRSAACCLALLGGCRNANQLETAPVMGTVTFNGKAVERGLVVFSPQAGRGGKGLIHPDGTYRISTYGKDDGAILGKHKVSVIATGPRKSTDEEPEFLVPPHFGEPSTSGLEFDVASDKDNRFDIELVDSS